MCYFFFQYFFIFNFWSTRLIFIFSRFCFANSQHNSLLIRAGLVTTRCAASAASWGASHWVHAATAASAPHAPERHPAHDLHHQRHWVATTTAAHGHAASAHSPHILSLRLDCELATFEKRLIKVFGLDGALLVCKFYVGHPTSRNG